MRLRGIRSQPACVQCFSDPVDTSNFGEKHYPGIVMRRESLEGLAEVVSDTCHHISV